MADPARKYDPDPSAGQDPFNPAPRPSSDPLAPEPLTTDIGRDDPYVESRRDARGASGNGLLIGAVIVILAAIAFYIFGPGATETTAPPAETPATTAAPAPSGTAPAAPAPQGAAPAEPAPAPAQPAQPAPAPAPAQ
jgi:hypothetical protein